MTDNPVPGGRVVRGDQHDTLHADDPLLLGWLKKIMKPSAFDGDNVVLPREPMDGLVSMARDRSFVIEVQGG